MQVMLCKLECGTIAEFWGNDHKVGDHVANGWTSTGLDSICVSGWIKEIL